MKLIKTDIISYFIHLDTISPKELNLTADYLLCLTVFAAIGVVEIEKKSNFSVLALVVTSLFVWYSTETSAAEYTTCNTKTECFLHCNFIALSVCPVQENASSKV